MRGLLEQMQGQRLYVFTTQGHIFAGVLESVLEDVIEMIAPNGTTKIQVSLTDVSGVRAYDVESEDVTLPAELQ
jgi:hypothetical protein